MAQLSRRTHALVEIVVAPDLQGSPRLGPAWRRGDARQPASDLFLGQYASQDTVARLIGRPRGKNVRMLHNPT
jgi:hypothetical protein